MAYRLGIFDVVAAGFGDLGDERGYYSNNVGIPPWTCATWLATPFAFQFPGNYYAKSAGSCGAEAAFTTSIKAIVSCSSGSATGGPADEAAKVEREV